jgi:hypothetical protein
VITIYPLNSNVQTNPKLYYFGHPSSWDKIW